MELVSSRAKRSYTSQKKEFLEVSRIEIEKIQEETWDNLERKTISCGKAVQRELTEENAGLSAGFIPERLRSSRGPGGETEEERVMGRSQRKESLLGPKGTL